MEGSGFASTVSFFFFLFAFMIGVEQKSLDENEILKGIGNELDDWAGARGILLP